MLKESTMESAKMSMLVVRFSKMILLNPLLDVLRWSFECLLAGHMPTHDHNGKEFTGSRHNVAGDRIAGHIIGDWLFFREVLDL